MDIASILTSQMNSDITMMKLETIGKASEEISEVATKVAETGDPAYILELSPLALSMFSQSGEK